jgi:hypothetical protein
VSGPNREKGARREEEGRKRSIAAAKAAAREAERNLTVARKQAERAAMDEEAASRRAKEFKQRQLDLEQQLTRVTKEAEAARAHASGTAADREEARRGVDSAERALELARSRLQQLVDGKT